MVSSPRAERGRRAALSTHPLAPPSPFAQTYLPLEECRRRLHPPIGGHALGRRLCHAPRPRHVRARALWEANPPRRREAAYAQPHGPAVRAQRHALRSAGAGAGDGGQAPAEAAQRSARAASHSRAQQAGGGARQHQSGAGTAGAHLLAQRHDGRVPAHTCPSPSRRALLPPLARSAGRLAGRARARPSRSAQCVTPAWAWPRVRCVRRRGTPRPSSAPRGGGGFVARWLWAPRARQGCSRRAARTLYAQPEAASCALATSVWWSSPGEDSNSAAEAKST